MIDPAIANQLPGLVGPLKDIITSGARDRGYHPIAISHAMLLAGMLELLEAAGKDFTIEILTDMVEALVEEGAGALLQ